MQHTGLRGGRSALSARESQPAQTSSKWMLVLVATSFVLGLYFGSSSHVFKPVLENTRLQSTSTRKERTSSPLVQDLQAMGQQQDQSGGSLVDQGAQYTLPPHHQASVDTSSLSTATLGPSPSDAPSPTPTPTPTPSGSHSGTPTPSHSRPPKPSKAAKVAAVVADYRETQVKATPFPPSYRSLLSAQALEMGIQVPDILQRARRENAAGKPCPPHAAGAQGLAGTVGYDEHGMGGPVPVVPTDKFTTPGIEALAGFSVGLAVQSHNSPATLANTLKSHAQSGLFELMDEKAVFLSAPVQAEIDLALSFGFKVYTPDPLETALVKARNMDFLQQFNKTDLQDQWNAFPHSRNIEKDGSKPPRWASYVAPSQAIMYMEMSSDIVLFAERDYVLPAGISQAQLVRSLLTGVALVATGTSAVRLRRVDDPNREVLTNCCQGECEGKYSGWGAKCSWESHLDWLSYFCDRDRIEERSGGQMKACMNEWEGITSMSRPPVEHRASIPQGATVPALTPALLALTLPAPEGVPVEPLSVYCFSSDSSGWSNNVAMFGRRWWLETLGHIAILSGPDNGNFEVNAHLWCGYAAQHTLGSGPALSDAPMVCQLDPGLFFHVELDV